MKKLLSLFIAFMLLLGLCACGGAEDPVGTTAAEEPAFLAGFGKMDITPAIGSNMGSYAKDSTRLCTGLGSYIYAICVAVTDAEGNTAILMSVDNSSLPLAFTDTIRDWATKEYGIPRENIVISSTHIHSGASNSIGNYQNLLFPQMKAAITQAMEDRAPAEIYTNKVQTQALSFVRRFWLNDGGFVTSQSCTGNRSSGFKDYESPADPEMRLIKFTRQDKEDIIMVNFQAHPHMGTSASHTEIHSDWPGEMRDVVTEELGAHCIYFSGAGGNLNSNSANPADNITQPTDDYRQHGRRAAKYVIGAEDSYTKVNTGAVRCIEQTITYDTDHSMDHLFDVASSLEALRKQQGNDAATAAVKNYPGLNSWRHAAAIVKKATAGPTRDLTIGVITFGDVAFTCHPYEMFDTNGQELRDGTVGNANYNAEDQLENPFDTTFVLSLANYGDCYIPSLLAFGNGGYEPDTTNFAAGTGEQLVGDYLHMLNELHAD